MIKIRFLILNGIFITFFAVGCFWHISTVSRMYFSHPISVSVEISTKHHIPGFTICFRVKDILSQKLVMERYAAANPGANITAISEKIRAEIEQRDIQSAEMLINTSVCSLNHNLNMQNWTVKEWHSVTLNYR